MVHILLVQRWPTDGKVLDTLCICVATVGYEWQNIANGPPLSHCWTTDRILKFFLSIINLFISNLIYCFLPYYLTVFNVKNTLFQNINILRGPPTTKVSGFSFTIGLPMSYPRQKSHWANGGCRRRTNRYTNVRPMSACSLGCWLMKVIHWWTNRKAYHWLPTVGH